MVSAGKGDSSAIVWSPAPGMAKSIVFVPPDRHVGVEDRLAERPGAAVGRRGDQEEAVRDDELGLEGSRTGRPCVEAQCGIAVEPRQRCIGQAIQRPRSSAGERSPDNAASLSHLPSRPGPAVVENKSVPAATDKFRFQLESMGPASGY